MNLPDNQEILRLAQSLPLASFVERVVASVAGAEVDCACTLAIRGSENKFVQLAAGADGDICGEVVSNRYLSGAERWTATERTAIEALGWVPPVPAPTVLPLDSPSLNYRRDWRAVVGDEREAAIAELSGLLTTTLTSVMGVASASELDVDIVLDR